MDIHSVHSLALFRAYVCLQACLDLGRLAVNALIDDRVWASACGWRGYVYIGTVTVMAEEVEGILTLRVKLVGDEASGTRLCKSSRLERYAVTAYTTVLRMLY